MKQWGFPEMEGPFYNGGIFIRMTETVQTEKALLDINSFCDYLSIGQTKARELLHNPANGFTVKIGNRLYAHKGRVDTWLSRQILQ